MASVTKAAAFDGFAELLASYGLSTSEILREVGLDIGEDTDPDTEIPLNAVASAFELAAHRAGAPCLGLELAGRHRLGASGTLGYILMNAPTVRDMVRNLERFLPLYVSAVEPFYSEDADGVACFAWTFSDQFTAPRQQYVSSLAATAVLRIRLGAGEDWTPAATELEHAELQCPGLVAELFGPNIAFNCAVNRFYIDAATLDRRLEIADPRLYGVLVGLGEKELDDRRVPADIVYRTRRQIARRLASGSSDLQTIAAALRIPPRSLQWQLAQAGTNFARLLSETRRMRAEHLLQNTDLALTDIGGALGFSELSSFTRAAKIWFGRSPRAWRHRMRSGSRAAAREDGEDE